MAGRSYFVVAGVTLAWVASSLRDPAVRTCVTGYREPGCERRALLCAGFGAAYGTAKSGVGIASMGVMRPELVMKSIVPVVMAGVLGIYGLIIAVIISTGSKLPRPTVSEIFWLVLCAEDTLRAASYPVSVRGCLCATIKTYAQHNCRLHC